AIAVVSEHWLKGGEGAIELAEAVVESSKRPWNFKFLYDLDMPLRGRINLIAKELYGAQDVSYSDIAMDKIKKIEADPETSRLGTCMVKTHLSLSHDANLKGRPRNWTLPVHDVLIYRGAGFVAPVAGDIKLMPGTASKPAFMNIDVDVKTGRVKGLF
ncbi:MAG: formate--tetrahydrofolate ligase, partial [Kiritimatiellae bacterium]|nr:formate--tetrahydrofolate ligase [Kiritimatiellia bacterium]